MPLANQLHVDQLLSGISVKYQPTDLIGMKVFPEFPVKKQSDLYRVYDRNLKVPETERAIRAEAREHQFEVSTASYFLKRHSLKTLVTDREAENYDISDLRAETTEELTGKLLSRLELDVAVMFTSTSWSLNLSLAAAGAWSANTITSDPAPQFHTGCSTVLVQGGTKPNFGIIPRDSYVAAKNHVSILDRLKYTTATVDAAKLAALFDIEELLIPSAGYDSSVWGAPGTTTNYANFYGDNVFIGYKPASPGPLKPSSGYVFRNSLPMVKRWRDEAREGEWIEVNMEYQVRVVASLSGYLIKDTIQ